MAAMRKVLAWALGLVVLVMAVGLGLHRPAPSPEGEPAAPEVAATRVLPPVPPPPSEAPTGAAPDAVTSPAVPSSTPPGSDLKVVEVAPRQVHAIDENAAAPAKPVSIESREGRVLRRVNPQPAAASEIGPLRGTARVVSEISLVVGNQAVRLYGVKAPAIGDRCVVARDGAARDCRDAARQALAERLQRDPRVSCRAPRDNARTAATICLDSTGVDLAGFLVSEGLALADRSESSDYAGAEGIARSLRRGLWRSR